MLVAIGTWGVGCLLWFCRQRAVAGVLALLAGLWVVYGLVGYPLLTDSSSSAALMRHAGQRIGPDAQLGLVAWREQNLLRSEEHTSELQSLMRNSYAVFCLTKNNKKNNTQHSDQIIYRHKQ